MPGPGERTIYAVDLPAQDGFDLKAYVVPDLDARADDGERYDPNEFADLIAAWKRDEFIFVGVIVEASREGVMLGDASIWGSEYGQIDGENVQPIGDDGTDNIGYLADLTRDALAAARTKLDAIS